MHVATLSLSLCWNCAQIATQYQNKSMHGRAGASKCVAHKNPMSNNFNGTQIYAVAVKKCCMNCDKHKIYCVSIRAMDFGSQNKKKIVSTPNSVPYNVYRCTWWQLSLSLYVFFPLRKIRKSKDQTNTKERVYESVREKCNNNNNFIYLKKKGEAIFPSQWIVMCQPKILNVQQKDTGEERREKVLHRKTFERKIHEKFR